MKRVANFAAGPSTMPVEVLEKISQDILEYNDSGMSIIEMSHRSKDFLEVTKKLENNIKYLLKVPDNYKILFMHGGATGQFASVPLNLRYGGLYVVTGSFSKKAYDESLKYVDSRIVLDTREEKRIPTTEEIEKAVKNYNPDSTYVHLTSNNTIYGTEYKEFPDVKNLVCDMSSDFLSRPVDVSKFGIIYAGVQKNAGPAGMAVVIIRDDLIRDPKDYTIINTCPAVMSYYLTAKNDSMYNTPPCFCIYAAMVMTQNLIDKFGDLDHVLEYNEKKAKIIYDYLDNSKLFVNGVNKKSRSIMNAVFTTGNQDLDEKFVSEAKKNGIVSIKGHRSVGGMRASIYNSMSIENVEKLVEFMKKFEEENL